jgi:hypothetical protein
MSDEASVMNELTEEIRGMRADFRNALTKLFGDAESENAHGRIPRLESVAEDHEKRIGALEKLLTRGQGAWHLAGWAVAAVVSLATLAYHAVQIYTAIKGH